MAELDTYRAKRDFAKTSEPSGEAGRGAKRRDEGADARRNPVSTQPEFVISGRTVQDAGD